MALERWDPLGDMMSLRDAMDRLLHESFVMPSGMISGGRQALPLDVIENDDNYVVSAWLPGVKPEDVQITVQGNTLTIRGETSYSMDQPQGQTQPGQTQPGQTQPGQTQPGQMQPRQDQVSQGQPQRAKQTGNWIIHERRHGTFYRAISLPTPVNADAATTRFEHGELVITLPKAEEARPKQIRIGKGQTASGQIQQPQ